MKKTSTELSANEFNSLIWDDAIAKSDLQNLIGRTIVDAEWIGFENEPREGLLLTVAGQESNDIYMASFNDDDPDEVFFTFTKARMKD